MSSQTNLNPYVSYFLSAFGLDQAYFNKLTAPPLGLLDKGILYELDDGVLYFNGVPLSSGSFSGDSLTLTPEAANPGTADTLWLNLAGQLQHGARNTEGNEPTILYVSTSGTTTAAGANGFINSPISTITDALSLYDVNGTSIQLTGDFSGESIMLPAQVIINGDAGVSFRSLVGPITIDNTIQSWVDPPPFGINQSFLNSCVCMGQIDYTAAGLDQPLLVLNDSSVQGGIVATDDDSSAYLLMRGCMISSTVSVENVNTFLICCSFGLLNVLPGSMSITHTDIAQDMTVYLSNCHVADGTVTINAGSTTNTLEVSLIGDCTFSTITVASVAAPGGLTLIVDDLAVPITWGPGAQANTTIVYTKKASEVGYEPAVPADWSPAPVIVGEALDQLAARVFYPAVSFRGVTTITGVNQNLVSGNNLTPIFSATDSIFDYISDATLFTNWYYSLDRALVVGESINVRLIVNGNPVVLLGPLDHTSPQTAIVPCSYSVSPGDKVYVLINAFGIIGAPIVTSYCLYGLGNQAP